MITPCNSTAKPSEFDVQTALARYSEGLHKYTQQLWMEARRKAELEASARSTRWKLNRKAGNRSSPPHVNRN